MTAFTNSFVRRIRKPSNLLLAFFLSALLWYFNSNGAALNSIFPPKTPTTSSPPPGSFPAVVPAAKPRIAILTFTTGEKSYTHLSLANKNVYARKHNYDLIVDYTVPPGSQFGNPVWHKLTMFEDAAATGKYDWLWWIDFDTVITNTSVKLEDVVAESLEGAERPEEVDFLLTADCFPLNAGSMLLRTTPRLNTVIASARACGLADETASEQDCIRDLLYRTPLGEKHARWIPQHKINAFPPEIPCIDSVGKGWSVGAFVVHFAGAWAHMTGYRDETGLLMRKYAEFVDTKDFKSGWVPEREKEKGDEVEVKDGAEEGGDGDGE